MKQDQFEPWMGHVPRDRASIWWITPKVGTVVILAVMGALVVAPVIAVVIG